MSKALKILQVAGSGCQLDEIHSYCRGDDILVNVTETSTEILETHHSSVLSSS